MADKWRRIRSGCEPRIEIGPLGAYGRVLNLVRTIVLERNQLLARLRETTGATLVIATHDDAVAAIADTEIVMSSSIPLLVAS